MARRLGLGQYYGRSVRRRQVNGFVITENRFPPGLAIPRHAHVHPHFTFVLQGAFTEAYDGMVLECPPGTTLFVPADATHTDLIGPAGAHTIGVELSPAVAERVVSQTGVLKDAFVLLDRRLELTGNRLYREFHSADSAARLSMEALAIEMLVLTSRSRKSQDASEPTWMPAVRTVLHDRFRETVSLDELARIAGVHRTHLARAFRQRHGCTVGEYIRRLRVDAAAMELKQRARSVAEIGVGLGFFDQAHFCRSFKRIYGLTPSAYRSR